MPKTESLLQYSAKQHTSASSRSAPNSSHLSEFMQVDSYRHQRMAMAWQGQLTSMFKFSTHRNLPFHSIIGGSGDEKREEHDHPNHHMQEVRDELAIKNFPTTQYRFGNLMKKARIDKPPNSGQSYLGSEKSSTIGTYGPAHSVKLPYHASSSLMRDYETLKEEHSKSVQATIHDSSPRSKAPKPRRTPRETYVRVIADLKDY